MTRRRPIYRRALRRKMSPTRPFDPTGYSEFARKHVGVAYTNAAPFLEKLTRFRYYPVDAMHDVMIKIMQAEKSYNPKKGEPSTFVKTVVKNFLKNKLREMSALKRAPAFRIRRVTKKMGTRLPSRKLDEMGIDPGHHGEPFVIASRTDLWKKIRRYISRLRKKDRDIVVNYVEGKTFQQIGVMVGMDRDRVAKRYQQLVHAMQRKFT